MRPREDQYAAFRVQIAIARRLGKPLVIHMRDSVDETLALLAAEAGGVTVILHCFSAPPDRVGDAEEHGWYCSFAGNVTYPKAGELREAAELVPAELLLVETDSPFLAPQPVRGKPNQPGPRGRHRRSGRGGARRLLRGARADGRGERGARLRMVNASGRASAGLGQNFLADPNLLDAIVRDSGAGGGRRRARGRRRGRGAQRAARAGGRAPACGRARRAAAPGARAARRPSSATSSLHWGDAMRLDFAALEPAPSALVSNLPYSIATPLLLRTIEELPVRSRPGR